MVAGWEILNQFTNLVYKSMHAAAAPGGMISISFRVLDTYFGHGMNYPMDRFTHFKVTPDESVIRSSGVLCRNRKKNTYQ